MNKNIQLTLGVLVLIIIGGLIYTSLPKTDMAWEAPLVAKNTPKTNTPSGVAGQPAPLKSAGQTQPPTQMQIHTSVTYGCTGGKSFSLTFSPTTLLTIAGKNYPVTPKVINKVDPAFVNEKENISFVNKGNYAYVEEGGKTTYDQCKPNL